MTAENSKITSNLLKSSIFYGVLPVFKEIRVFSKYEIELFLEKVFQ